jgi:hypothetical protein
MIGSKQQLPDIIYFQLKVIRANFPVAAVTVSLKSTFSGLHCAIGASGMTNFNGGLRAPELGPSELSRSLKKVTR